MKRYRLIKKYPNSPELGTVIKNTGNEYYTIHPEKYSEFWREFTPENSIISEDGYEILEGDLVYYLSEFKIYSITFRPEYHSDFKLWHLKENCLKYLESQIEISTEDGVVKENIPLYAVLSPQYTTFKEVTSLELFIRDKTKMTPRSGKWKYFKSKESMIKYIEDNKQQYSKKDLIQFIEQSELHRMFKIKIKDLILNYL